MNFKIISLFDGLPVKCSRGFMGWSSVYLIKIIEDNNTINILFDTGGFNERSELTRRLKLNGVDRSQIDFIFISHLHFDHCVNWPLFPNAKILVGEREVFNSLHSDDLNVPEFHAEKLINHPNVKLVNDGENLFSFEIVLLPGHTYGLLGLQYDGHFLVSDAIKNRSEINDMKLMNVLDENSAKKTIKSISDSAKIIYPGHDGMLELVNGRWDILEDLNEDIFISTLGESKFKTTIKVN